MILKKLHSKTHNRKVCPSRSHWQDRGGSSHSWGGAGSSKRQDRRNFQTDKQRSWGGGGGGGVNHITPLDPPLQESIVAVIVRVHYNVYILSALLEVQTRGILRPVGTAGGMSSWPHPQTFPERHGAWGKGWRAKGRGTGLQIRLVWHNKCPKKRMHDNKK